MGLFDLFKKKNIIEEENYNTKIKTELETGKLTDTIEWTLDNNILTISGEGKLSKDSYLSVFVPRRVGTHCCEYDSVYVLPWAVSKTVRLHKGIGEGTSVNDIPNKTKVKKLVINGNMQGLEKFILGAENIDGYLQSPEEYFDSTNTEVKAEPEMEQKIDTIKCSVCLRNFHSNDINSVNGKNFCRDCMPNFPSIPTETEYFDELWYYKQKNRGYPQGKS